MEKPDKTNKVNDINACVNRMWLLFNVVAKKEHEEATAAYLEEKERVTNLLREREDFMEDTTPGQIVTIGVDLVLPEGEIRLNRKRWPKNSSPVVVLILFQGLFFTLARAAILVGKEKKLFYAEGISRLSPLDDPDNPGRDRAWKPILKKKKSKEIPEAKADSMISCERAIRQAVEALHTRVMKNRRSFHHYRG